MCDMADCRYGGFDEGTYEQFEEYVKKVDEFKVKLPVPAAVRAPILSRYYIATIYKTSILSSSYTILCKQCISEGPKEDQAFGFLGPWLLGT